VGAVGIDGFEGGGRVVGWAVLQHVVEEVLLEVGHVALLHP